MKTIGQILNISKDQETPIVSELIDYIKQQGEMIQKLKDEIAELKGQKPKPKIEPSNLEKETNRKRKPSTPKRPGSQKRSKTKKLEIHEEIVLEPKRIPKGSQFKGYQDFTVQDFVIGSWNVCYKRARYKTPNGKYIIGKMPKRITKSHFGPTLTAFILYQYYHAHVTQPLIFEQLKEYGVEISKGQINRIIIENKNQYHKEKQMILSSGLKHSGYINVDDTAARHNGKNGYCTHVGNDFFAWFKTSERKNRINFLELLQSHHKGYVINNAAIDYMKIQRLPKYQIRKFDHQILTTKPKWKSFLFKQNITNKRHKRIATEAALLGSLIHHGLNQDLVIVSDEAGQFHFLKHALCWVHAERMIQKMIVFSKDKKNKIESIRSDIWNYYSKLKDYQLNPTLKLKAYLNKRFDEIFNQKTGYALLDAVLKRIFKRKTEYLLVLERPDIPLHNNLSESDIREYVKRRKISGSTRSPTGKNCRDTFTSLKKTCRKLGISFWDYLIDRIENKRKIPLLADLMVMKMEGQHIKPVPQTY